MKKYLALSTISSTAVLALSMAFGDDANATNNQCKPPQCYPENPNPGNPKPPTPRPNQPQLPKVETSADSRSGATGGRSEAKIGDTSADSRSEATGGRSEAKIGDTRADSRSEATGGEGGKGGKAEATGGKAEATGGKGGKAKATGGNVEGVNADAAGGNVEGVSTGTQSIGGDSIRSYVLPTINPVFTRADPGNTMCPDATSSAWSLFIFSKSDSASKVDHDCLDKFLQHGEKMEVYSLVRSMLHSDDKQKQAMGVSIFRKMREEANQGTSVLAQNILACGKTLLNSEAYIILGSEPGLNCDQIPAVSVNEVDSLKVQLAKLESDLAKKADRPTTVARRRFPAQGTAAAKPAVAPALIKVDVNVNGSGTSPCVTCVPAPLPPK